MATLARLNDFTAGTTAVADDVDAEFDQLVEALNGTKTNVRYILKAADAGNPVLELDNTSGGPLLRLKKSGVTRATFNLEGVLDSDVPDGTAPLDMLSTTVCPNLNADMLDGQHASAFITTPGAQLQEDGSNLTVLRFMHDVEDETRFVDNGDTTFIMKNQTDAVDYFSANKQTGVVDFPNGLQVGAADVATEAYVDAKDTVWSFGVFFEGTPTTAAKQPRFIVPLGVDTFTLDRARVVFDGGSPTGSTVVRVRRRNSSGTVLNTYTITLLIGATSGTTLETDLSNTPLSSGDQLEVDVTTVGGHQNLSVHVQGTQALG